MKNGKIDVPLKFIKETMKIKLNSDVTTTYTKNGKTGYSTAEVGYTNDRGEAKQWKLRSFSNPAVYDILKEAKAGESFEITVAKNDKDFTEWAKAVKITGDEAPIVKAAASMAPVRSTYETPEERALKQRLIVRQSSLAQAIVFYNKSTDDVEQLLGLAERFADWVYEKVDLFDEPNDLTAAS